MVPEIDYCCLDAALGESFDLSIMEKYCRKFRTAIQAGGNVGVFPVKLSEKFQKVYTVEPDAMNFLALKENTSNISNIDARRAAFGREEGTGSIDDVLPGNIGAYQVKEGGDFRIMKIDSLRIKDCDFLQLDVEGFEQFALEGGIETIKASLPLIVLELKGLGLRYGITDKYTHDWLFNLGYRLVEKVHQDSIYINKFRKI